MERWAANTLRILGIIVTSLLVICGCLFLVLLGQCAAHGGFAGVRNPNAATSYYFGAVLLGFAGIWFIAWLARGIHRSRQTSPTTSAPSSEAPAPVQPASASRRAVDLLTWALIAQLVVSALLLVYTVLLYQTMPYMRHSTIPTVISSALFALPYALILYFVRRRVSRAVLAFALGVPAASILLVLITTLPLLHFYIRSPLNLAMLAVPLVIDIATIVLAYQAQQPTGLVLPASSLFTTAVTSLVYFYSVHLITQFVLRNFAR